MARRRSARLRARRTHARVLGEMLENRSLLSAQISGRVWNDAARDGVRSDDPLEYGIADIAVLLLDGDLALLDRARTDVNGEYKFSVSQPGRYVVRFDPRDGTEFTAPKNGPSDRDSDAHPAKGRTDDHSVC